MAVVLFDESRNELFSIEPQTLEENLTRVTNQIFRLLPCLEEGKDWIKPLETLIVELSGMASLIHDEPTLFSLVCKLEGLRLKGEEMDFFLFRRTIFECCGIVNSLKDGLSCQ